MHPRIARSRTLKLIVTTALIATTSFVATGCDDDSTAPEATIVGSWNVTSFQLGGTDFIAGGMMMTMALTGSTTSGSYSIQVTNDLLELCDNDQTSCNPAGTYTATGSQLTFDPTGDDPTVFTISFQGSSMTWVGTIDEQPVTIVLERQ